MARMQNYTQDNFIFGTKICEDKFLYECELTM